MAEKIKKKLPWFLILVLIVFTVAVGFNFERSTTKADSLGTSVSVGNQAPAFTVVPADSSDGTTPTNVGANTTFTATATDANSEQYYLAICKENSITPATDGAPTCGGTGSWCVSIATNSASPANCTRTALVGDAESNIWYGFVCDKHAGEAGLCSSNSSAASPFKVNHRPGFTVFSDNSPVNPAATVTWTTTASDTDTDTANDTVSLYVCKADDFTGTACGGGGTWCSVTGQASNPTCNVAAPLPDGNYSAYGFVIDSHSFAASPQGGDSTLAVNNMSPSITNTTILLQDTDAAGDLTLTVAQGETTDFLVKFVITDANSCVNISSGNEIASALIHARMSELAQSACDGNDSNNNNNCYQAAQSGTGGQCVQDVSINACSGNTDTDVGWRCEFPLQYHADPTTGTPTPTKDAYTWTVAVQATDDDSATTGLVDDNDGNELGLFMAYSFTEGSIAYGGPLAPEAESADKTLTVSATGNVGLDEEVSGAANMCTDYPTCVGSTISVVQQKYDLDSGIAWASMNGDGDDGTLSATAHEVETNCLKTTTTGSPATKILYWKIKIPAAQASGSYTGADTLAGVTGEAAGW